MERFKSGDKEAANQLIALYFDRVVAAAKNRLRGARIRASSEEDVAASVFESLWKRADGGGFSEDELASPDEFWRLLCTMVRNKAHDHIRRQKAAKRGGGRLRGESVFISPGDQAAGGIADFAVTDDSISAALGFRDEYEHLMRQLDDLTLAEIATMRLEGRTVSEIAQHFQHSDRWVKRKLALIRQIWSSIAEE